MLKDSHSNSDFASFVNSDLVKVVMGAPIVTPTVDRQLVPILLIQANSDPINGLPAALAMLIDKCIAAAYFVDFQFANIIFMRTKPSFKNAKEPMDIQAFWSNVTSTMPGQARAVWGEADCLVGDLGSSKRGAFGAFMINPEPYLDRLFHIEFGVIERVEKK